MRPLHVTHQYRPAIGGAERYMTDLSEELVRRGHHVVVYTSRSTDYVTWHSTLPPLEQLDGVEVYRFSSLVRRGYTWRALDFGLRNYRRTRARRYEPFILLGNGPLCPGLFFNLLRHGRRFDLVHLNSLHYAHTAYGYLAARLRGLPVVVTPHVHMEQDETYDVGYFQAILRGADLVFAVTKVEKDFLVGLGVDSGRVVVGGNSIRLDELPRQDARAARARLGLPADAFIVLFLGRRTEYKGLDLTLEAFQRLKYDHPQLVLVVAGPNTDYSREMLARYNGLERLVDLGAPSQADKVAALNACDVLCLPSGGEAFGIVFLEAWAVGKPVIGARAGAIPTVITEGHDGLLIEPGNAADLEEKLRMLIRSRDLCRELGVRGHARVHERYTAARIGDIVEEAYRRLLERATQRDRHRGG